MSRDGEPTVAGLSLRDWFATFAPEPPGEWMVRMRSRDQTRARGDDRFRMRSDTELRAAWAYEWADALMRARRAGP